MISELLSHTMFFVIVIFFFFFIIIRQSGQIKLGNFCLYVYPLAIIVCVGVLLGFIGLISKVYNVRDILRDIFYFSAPIVYLLFSYNLTKFNFINKKEIQLSFIVAGIVLSIIHLYVVFVLYKFQLNAARGNITGYESVVTIISLYVCILFYKNKRLKIIICGIFIISLLLFVSRTVVLMALAILVIILFGERLNKKRVFNIFKVIFILLLIIYGVYIFLPQSSVNIFIGKVTNIFNEINNEQTWSFDAINANWRGYEKHLIEQELLNSNIFNQLLGFGFGKLQNLGLSISLGGTKYSEIGTFHNGYYYIALKTGLVGLILFSVFLFYAINMHINNRLK